MAPDQRRDDEIWGAWGQLTALEVALIALFRSHPDKDALRSAWQDAQDTGFMQTSDVDPRVGELRLRIVREGYLATLARLRAATE